MPAALPLDDEPRADPFGPTPLASPPRIDKPLPGLMLMLRLLGQDQWLSLGGQAHAPRTAHRATAGGATMSGDRTVPAADGPLAGTPCVDKAAPTPGNPGLDAGPPIAETAAPCAPAMPDDNSPPNPADQADQAVTSHSLRQAGWHLAWAQCSGAGHLHCEDSIRHRLYPAAPAQPGAVPDLVPGAGRAAIAVAVADGVGGGARGDMASRALAEHCSTDLPAALVPDHDGLQAWLGLSEARVQQALRRVTFGEGASTLVAAWLGADGAGLLHPVGDARAYRLSPGAAALALTTDHSYANLGLPPPAPGRQHDPARRVGTNTMGQPVLAPLHLAPGDTLLLCSDGLHRHVTPGAMANALANADQTLLQQAEPLVRQALAGGSRDDISVLLLQAAPAGAPTRPALPATRPRMSDAATPVNPDRDNSRAASSLGPTEEPKASPWQHLVGGIDLTRDHADDPSHVTSPCRQRQRRWKTKTARATN